MESSPIILQKIRKEFSSQMEVARKYYALLSLLNDLKLTHRETQLLAFTAVRGSISSGTTRQLFAQSIGSSKATVNNMVHKLSTLGYIIKDKRKVIVNPRIALDFSATLLLQLSFSHAEG